MQNAVILNSHHAYQCLRFYLRPDVEELWALALDSGQMLKNRQCIFRGTVDACLVHPRDIFRFACLNNASALIIAHNHPSNDLMPSADDLRFTKKLIQLGTMMEIPLIDHLILGARGYISMADLRIGGFGRQRRPSSRPGPLTLE